MPNFVIGEPYKVRAEDCCVRVYFTSILVEHAIVDGDETYKFANGVKISGTSVRLEEL